MDYLSSMTSFRRITLLATVFLSAAIVVPLSAVHAAIPATVHLTVHYQRPAGDYKDWNVYLWRDVSGAGDKEVSAAGFPFTASDSYGQIAKIDVTDMTGFTGLGIIIRRGAWAEKDTPDDRFITNFDANKEKYACTI